MRFCRGLQAPFRKEGTFMNHTSSSHARKNTLGYVLLSTLAVLAVVLGCRFCSREAMLFTGQTGRVSETLLVKADTILSVQTEETVISQDMAMTQTEVRFTGTVIYGPRKGDSVAAVQSYDSLLARRETPVEKGDWLFVHKMEGMEGYFAGNFFRIRYLAVLFVVLLAFLILFAGIKGIATTAALGLSIASVFLVFVPAILSGYNVYLWSLLVCVYSIVITPLFIGGFNKKSLASILGCVGGVSLAAALTAVLNVLMKITGSASEDDMYVMVLLSDPIDMRAITFAAVLIGALGSTLDVSMSIAASVWELHENGSKRGFAALLESGFNIGRDILGTQISTLILAYIGSSLSTVLLLAAYQPSLMELLNLEVVIIQLMDMLIGAAAILLTIPFTALVSALMLAGEKSGTKRVSELSGNILPRQTENAPQADV